MDGRIQTRFLTASLAVLALLVPVRAQEDQPGAGPAPRARENLITFKLMRMTQVLELTEEQTAKIFPTLTRMEREKFEISNRLNERMRALRALLQADKPEEAKMTAAIGDIAALRLEIRNKDEEADSFLRENLTLKQYGRYTLFLVDFHRGLEEKLNRARMMRTAPPSKRTPDRRQPQGGL
jgi:Spy/CpxP family protein refolding chaperone